MLSKKEKNLQSGVSVKIAFAPEEADAGKQEVRAVSSLGSDGSRGAAVRSR